MAAGHCDDISFNVAKKQTIHFELNSHIQSYVHVQLHQYIYVLQVYLHVFEWVFMKSLIYPNIYSFVIFVNFHQFTTCADRNQFFVFLNLFSNLDFVNIVFDFGQFWGSHQFNL